MIGEDTDLLVLLLHHVEPTMQDVFLTSGSYKKNRTRIWAIKATQARLGRGVCGNILFAHAFCGCDTTSRAYNISKSLPIKKLKNNDFVKDAQIFLADDSNNQVIAEAGERVFVSLYNGRHDDTLDHLRLVRYQQKVSSSISQVQAKVLPPTSSAARHHSYRVYFQVQEWATLGRCEHMPEEWGWELRRGQLIPVTTDIPPAPEDLLNVIRCTCKKDCSSGRCSCRKHGLTCTTACGECRGVSCMNTVHQLEESGESDSEM